LHGLFPELVRHPGAYVLVGMAGFFAGAANTPVSTIIMVSEMTGNYQLLLPALWVTTICYLLLRRAGIYEKQCRSRVDSPAHRGDMHFDVLEDMTVADVYDRERPVVTFPRSAPLGKILKQVGDTHQSYFPILDEQSKLCGIFSLNDIREFMYDEGIWALAVADDVATENVLRVTERDSLNTAIRRLTGKNIDELPVVAAGDADQVIGLLRRKEVLDAYNRRLWALRQETMGDE
jgi:CIC family chloride channel protein